MSDRGIISVGNLVSSVVVAAVAVLGYRAAVDTDRCPAYAAREGAELGICDTGQRVAQLKVDLGTIGIDAGVGPNFDLRTRNAVLQFQALHPPLAQDGLYGPDTAEALREALDAQLS